MVPLRGSDTASGAGAVHAALASPTRRKIVALMESRDCPGPDDGSPVWNALELAEATGLHVTTVRFHLDVLRRAGLVMSLRQVRHTSGRPRIGFRLAAAPTESEDQPYRMLASLLAEGLADAGGARSRRAERLGRKWAATAFPVTGAGQTAAAERPPAERHSVTGVVMQAFDELGFAPSHEVEPDYDIFELHACPFAEVAAHHPEVVCGMHRGLLRGLVDGTGGCDLATGVQSFVKPGLCVAHVRSTRLPTASTYT